MTAQTLTLTDFLLDRLADLELAAQIAQATARRVPIEGITPAGAVWFTPEQVLADVAAKRAIVEGAQYEMSPAGEKWVLRQLAEPHADHPDYRPEWRP